MDQTDYQSTRGFIFTTKLATTPTALTTVGFRELATAIPPYPPKVDTKTQLSGVAAICEREIIGGLVLRRLQAKSSRWLMTYVGVLPEFRRATVASAMLEFWSESLEPSEIMVKVPERLLDVQLFLARLNFLALKVERGYFGEDHDAITFSKVC